MKRLIPMCAAALVLTTSGPAHSDELSDLKDQVRALSQRVEALQQSQEDARRAAAVSATAPPAAVPTGTTPPAATAASGGKLPVFTAGPFSLDIYGTLLPLVSPIRASNNTYPSPVGGATQVPASAYTATVPGTRTAFTSGSSNLGFRGSYAFTPDMRAVFQIEGGVQLDGSTGANTIGSRNTWVGFQSDTYGFAFFGTNYTPYWYVCCSTSILKGSTISDVILTGVPGFNAPAITQQAGRAVSVADATFSRRQGNSLNYWSPKFAGFSARLQYSTNETKAAVVTSGPVISPTTASAALFYQNGGLDVRYAYEQHRDYFGMTYLGGAAAGTATNQHARDFGSIVNASYKFPTKTQFGIAVEKLQYSDTDAVIGNVRSYGRNAVQLFGVQTIGAHSLALRLSKAQAGDCERVGGAACTTNGLGAKSVNLVYLYNIMPSLDLYSTLWQLRNDRSATYTTTDRNAVPGEKQSGAGVGVQFVY